MLTTRSIGRRRILLLVALVGVAGCASSREVVVGTDPGASGATAGDEGVGSARIQSELARLMTAQGAFFDENGYYASDLGTLDFQAAPGVRVDLIQGDRDGFSAIARSGDVECAVYSGDVRPPRGYLAAPDRSACRE